MKTPYFTCEWHFPNIRNIYCLEKPKQDFLKFFGTTKAGRKIRVEYVNSFEYSNI